jgi:hypothetical protein
MTDLLIVTDVSQVEALLAGPRLAPDRVRVVTRDLAAAALLEQEKVPFLEEWDFLGPDDLDRNWHAAYDLAARWWDEGLVPTEYHGFPLAETARQEWAWVFEMCLNAHAVYERILDAVPAREVRGYFLPRVPICQAGPHPYEQAASSLVHAVLRWCAAQRGLPVRRLPLPGPLASALGPQNHEPSPPPAPAPRTPAPLARLLAEAPGRVYWETPPEASAAAGDRRDVLVMQWLAAREVAELERGFDDRAGWRMIRVALEGGDPFASLPWHTAAMERHLRRARAAQRAQRFVYKGPHPEVFANPFLQFQFDRIWMELGRAARLGESFLALLDEVRPSLVLFGYDGFVIERALARLARGRGVPTAALIHGGLFSRRGYRVAAGDTDHLLVWGPEDARWLARCGVQEVRAHPVGSLRYDDVYRSGARCGVVQGMDREPARRRLGLPLGQPVVLLPSCAIISMAGTPLVPPAPHRRTWRDIMALAARRPDLTFAVKPHPGWDHYELFRRLCRDAPANFRFLYDAHLTAALAAANAAVLVNVPTTAGLEAMLHGVPLVIVRDALYPTPQFEDPLHGGGALVAGNTRELETVLDRLCGDPAFGQTARAGAAPFLASFFGGDERPALERLLEACGRLASRLSGRDADRPSVQAPLSSVTGLLGSGKSRQSFLGAWESLVGGLVPNSPPPVIQQLLFTASGEIGRTANDADDLRGLVRRCFRVARERLGLSGCERRNMLANALLAALVRRVRAGQTEEALGFVRLALAEAPRALARLVRSAPLREALGRALGQAERVAADLRSLQTEVVALRQERESLAGLCQAGQQELARLRGSWSWKMARLLVRPGALLRRVLRSRNAPTA